LDGYYEIVVFNLMSACFNKTSGALTQRFIIQSEVLSGRARMFVQHSTNRETIHTKLLRQAIKHAPNQ